MKVDDLAKQFESNAKDDLQETITAQMRALVQTNKKLKLIEEENAHLKKLLTQTNPIIVSMDQQGVDEELIARSELRKLRQYSQDRELSMEETKKVEIYSKIMANIANKPKAIEVSARNLKTEELFAALDNATEDKE